MNKTYYLLRFLIIISFIALVVFLYGFIKEVNVGHPVLYVLLTTALFFKILKVLFEWFHYINIPDQKESKVVKLNPKQYSVDMLTTACPGEPYDMFEETLSAMVAVEYPHTTYLCDEGNDPQLIELCNRLGVIHVTRSTHENAKAGNINNALKNAKGEIVVILDPDHVPSPDFLDKVLPYFEDPQIGYVQVVQAYKNQAESFVARAAAEQTYNFYGPFMRAMGSYGSAQAIGANCSFRREALESIGGHAPGLTEDMHTSMLLHAKGWKSKYVPVVISRGLVPSSLSAFYKQQLKWSRGTFDLWFNLFPKLFKKFTLPQKIHYGLMPVYYLFGLVVIIDITVPIYSLLTGEYPWLLNPILFFSYFTPFLILSLIVRLSAQKYLHDPHEKGLHFFGGILRVGSWWVFTVGFIYTLLNIKVPYIPTPKEHTSKNEFALGLPNLLVAVISIAAGIYGLTRDWQPYSFLMATFAFSNAIIFLLAFAIGQSKGVTAVRNYWQGIKKNSLVTKSRFDYHNLNRLATPGIILILIFISSFLLPFSFTSEIERLLDKNDEIYMDREVGGFYAGIYVSNYNSEGDYSKLEETEKNIKWSVVSTYLAWGDKPLPIDHWNQIISHNSIPMITWEPWTNLFSEYQDIPDLKDNKKVFHYILEGYFDTYIDEMAHTLGSLNSPIFLRFAHEMQNPMYPWSATGGNTSEEFTEAWKYIHTRFARQGAHNVTWVWSPWSVENLESYFPYGQGGAVSEFVDWISITGLHYDMPDQSYQPYNFSDIYDPFKKVFDSLGLYQPIMVAEFGSTSYQTDNVAWNNEALQTIKSDYPEIQSVVWFYSNQDANFITDWRSEGNQYLDWTFDLSKLSNPFSENQMVNSNVFIKSPVQKPYTRNNNIQGHPGNFEWIVDNKPYYVQGVSFNPGHDWQEGFFPLSRNQLEKDFQLIKGMGANTIRRYGRTIYDRNLLNIAAEYDLNIIFGFWFEADIDYLEDKAALSNYRKETLDYIKKNLNNKNVIAWNLGNDTWGNLRKHFAQPYLSANRKAYLSFLEELTQEIHKIDPSRPVISSERHEKLRLPSILKSFRQHAPSIDIIGINAYYNENLSSLDSIYNNYDSTRPYLITEFGPKGYWNQSLGDVVNDSIPIEISSVKKAEYYQHQWTEYIQNNKGNNLGGVAYSWKDKYEGTATWFGITDYKGRLKPAYYSLQQVWQSEPTIALNFPDIAIVGQSYLRAPGELLSLEAAVTNAYHDTDNLKYDWVIIEDGTWKEFKTILNSYANNKAIDVQMPQTKSTYRVYLYVTDSKNNVITASRPLLYQ